MHNKIIKIFKQLSFITSHPDADWVKIFIVTIAALIYLLSYNLVLYFDTESNIESLGSAIILKKPQVQPTVQRDDELTKVIKAFDEKAKKNIDLRNSKPVPLKDPISN